jgi:hypothetical protein
MEALSAYSKLSDSLPTIPATSEYELQQNDQRFASAFTEVLESVGLSAEAPYREDNSSCAT